MSAGLTKKTPYGWVCIVRSADKWTAGAEFGCHATALRAFLAFRAMHRAHAMATKAGSLAAHLKLSEPGNFVAAANWAEWNRWLDQAIQPSVQSGLAQPPKPYEDN